MIRSVIGFSSDVLKHFSKSKTFQEGAALAYYTVFSLLPMIMIVVSIFGLFWGEAAVSGQLHQGLSNTLGPEAATQIEGILKAHHTNYSSVWTSIISLLTLALGATGMFNQLHTAFNNIWQLEAPKRNGFLSYLIKHATAFSILLGTFFLLMLSISINSFLVKYGSSLPPHFPINLLTEHIISYSLMAIAFALMFKYLGDANVVWKVALLGGLFTALLFIIGKFAIGMYLGHSNISTTFGSASVLALVMVWVYYTSQILFLGASFVYVLAERYGLNLAENDGASLSK